MTGWLGLGLKTKKRHPLVSGRRWNFVRGVVGLRHFKFLLYIGYIAFKFLVCIN
jgi:hypothetical protein